MILVVAEQQRGKLHRASWEAMAAGQELAGDQSIEAIVLGTNPSEAAAELGRAAVTTVHVIDSPLLDPYTPDAYTDTLQKAIVQLAPRRGVPPRIARVTRAQTCRRRSAADTACTAQARDRPTPSPGVARRSWLKSLRRFATTLCQGRLAIPRLLCEAYRSSTGDQCVSRRRIPIRQKPRPFQEAKHSSTFAGQASSPWAWPQGT